MYLCFTFYT
ncbi:hypothetical protein Zm00014a_033873 [Zea mays]|uniref:Uncharacterized protein n=1 Tax=Zea mays TaxID=4577 RepID=A0A3L6DIU4_MAIZE|nr:hypothetical protein Zm00014a_033873 [Zea mays]